MPENRIEQLAAEFDKLSFEQAFQRLEELVANMETGEQSLANALDDYEEAKLLAHWCAHLLERAELKVRQLSDDDIDRSRDEF